MCLDAIKYSFFKSTLMTDTLSYRENMHMENIYRKDNYIEGENIISYTHYYVYREEKDPKHSQIHLIFRLEGKMRNWNQQRNSEGESEK